MTHCIRCRSAACHRRFNLQFEDNRLLPSLFGQHDRNLARIERSSASPWSLAATRRDLAALGRRGHRPGRGSQDLYDRSKRGLEVDREIDAAIRWRAVPRRATTGHRCSGPSNGRSVAANRASGTSRRARLPRRRICAPCTSHDLVFGLGPAGTGKTYLAVAMAVAMLVKSAHRPADPFAAGGRGRRAAGLPARRPQGKGRSLSAPALRRAARHAARRASLKRLTERRDRGGAARLHARPDPVQLPSSSWTRPRTPRRCR